MTRTGVFLAAVSLSLPLFAPSILRADPITPGTLPDATASEILSVPASGQSGSFAGFGLNEINYSVPLGPPYGSLQTFTNAIANASGGQDPFVTANLSIGNVTAMELEEQQFNGDTAQSDLSYSFIVTGPGSAPVPVDISATGGATAPSGESGAAAELSIASSTGAVLLDDGACEGLIGAIPESCLSIGPPQSQFSLADQIIYVQPDQVYTVDLLAETTILTLPLADTQGLQQVDGGNAYVDPAIVLDPSVGSQYTLSFSSNLTATPEPNYLPIMLPCLAGLLLYLKHSKENSTTVQVA